jgi:hypothetical protein
MCLFPYKGSCFATLEKSDLHIKAGVFQNIVVPIPGYCLVVEALRSLGVSQDKRQKEKDKSEEEFCFHDIEVLLLF